MTIKKEQQRRIPTSRLGEVEASLRRSLESGYDSLKLNHPQEMNAKQPGVVPPGLDGLQAGFFCQRLKLGDIVFVGILGVDGLALEE